jgi:uncharacterized protein YdgA (DUF945 family)
VKRFFSIVVILLVLVSGLRVGAGYWFGLKTEEQYHDFLREASQWQYLKLVNESYNRGLFESNARTLVEIQHPAGSAGDNQPIRLTLTQAITHGPFSTSTPDGKWQFRPFMAFIETRLVLGPEAQSRIAEVYAQIPELASVRAYTVIHLDGGGEEHFTIPPFQHTLGQEDKVAVAWKGLSLKVDFSADLKRFTGVLSFPGLEVVAKDISLKIEAVKSSFDSHEGISGLTLGEASFDVGVIDLAAKPGTGSPALLVRAFNARTSSRAAGDEVNLRVALTADQIRVNENQYGPGIFEMEFRNLDAPSLARLQQTLREQQTAHAHQSPEAAQMAMLAGLGEILPGLLRKSPELEIRQLDLKTSLGDFSGKAKVAFDGKQPGSTQNLLALATAIAAQAEFTVGDRLLRHMVSSIMKENFIEQRKEQQGASPGEQERDAIASAEVSEQLKALTAQNILVKDNGTYRASLSYKAGQLVLNGRPLSLQDLMR